MGNPKMLNINNKKRGLIFNYNLLTKKEVIMVIGVTVT